MIPEKYKSVNFLESESIMYWFLMETCNQRWLVLKIFFPSKVLATGYDTLTLHLWQDDTLSVLGRPHIFKSAIISKVSSSCSNHSCQ